MQTTEQVVPIRTPEAALEGEIVRVINPDGSTREETDPKLPAEKVVALYRAMVRTRIIDEQLVKLQRQGRIGFHIGSLGEEACIIGSAAAMREDDWILPCYREFGALLLRGFPLQSYVDNMYGNCDDQVKGRQMPDHYTSRKDHFGSVSSPIGTQITQAVGLGWAARAKGKDEAVGVYFGEGATSSNDFHAGLNFGGVYKAPVVFLCRNNRWAISVPSERQTASRTFAEKAVAYGIRGVRCDGNDLLATYRTVRDAVERASRGEGPTLVEMLTYRLGGHSTSDDPRAYRVQDEVERWERTDPMIRTRRHLDQLGVWSDAQETQLRDETLAELRGCIQRAEAKDPPELDSIFDEVFEERPWHLEEQREQMLAGPRTIKHH
ncbi:MAG: thiamine pyrophosphate-dependent enzyme [Myxococcales bacterium]|nr:thiamine pyrophosphate-dependent enzyme [Myxococcales bacterium]